MKKPRFREKNNRIENQIALGNAIKKRVFTCKNIEEIRILSLMKSYFAISYTSLRRDCNQKFI